MKNPIFTVFTSAYNREKKIHRVYESLKDQTFDDFEWLIVDDGSKDGTKELVRQWQKEASFPIRYVYKENGGHHTAVMRGVQEAAGELFLTLDSDDGCLPDSLETFYRVWTQVPNKGEYSGVTGLCVDPEGQVIGDLFPKDVIDSTTLEIRYRYEVKGEKWGFTRTDLLREYSFPDVEGVRWFPPSIVWLQIGKKYKTRYINHKLRIYYTDPPQTSSDRAEYFPVKKVAYGISFMHRMVLNQNIDTVWFSPKNYLRFAVHYCRFSYHCEKGFVEQYKELKNPIAHLLWGLGFPLGYFLFLRDKLRQPKNI